MNNLLYLFYNTEIQSTVVVFAYEQISYIKAKPKKIIKSSCSLFGCEYSGAKVSFSKLTNIKRKIPICLSVYFRIIMIPSVAESNDDCVYIQYNKIKKIKPVHQGCVIEFKEGSTVHVNCSARSLKKQIAACDYFLEIATNPHNLKEMIVKGFI